MTTDSYADLQQQLAKAQERFAVDAEGVTMAL